MRVFSADNFLIMIVDDDSQNREFLRSILEQSGYKTTLAFSGQEALELIKFTKPDLILLALVMQNLNGLQVFERLKADSDYQDIPIVLLADREEKHQLLKAFELGIKNYFIRPFIVTYLLKKIKLLILKFIRNKLNKTITDLEKIAVLEQLTVIPNRCHILTITEQKISLACYYNYPISILIICLDNLNFINDTYGELVGNEVLIFMAKKLNNFLRKEDYLVRFNQGSFLGFLPHTGTQFALEIAERLRQKIGELSLNVENQQIYFTVSIGVATYQVNESDIEELLKRAEQALFQAKNREVIKWLFIKMICLIYE